MQSPLYAPLGNDEADELLSGEKLSYARRTRFWRSNVGLTIYLALLHAAIAVLLVLLVFRPEIPDLALWTHELASARDFIRYETVRFAPTGFTAHGEAATLYEGAPSAENNALWLNLTRVGMYALPEAEYAALHADPVQNLTTAPTVDPYTGERDGNGYIVTLEVFHQLHCLNYVRQRAYETPGDHFQPETDVSRRKHLSHCIDYLRQVLMCHADMTPITLRPAPKRSPPYFPNFDIVHTCRNWDLVYEFATRGNTTGVTVE